MKETQHARFVVERIGQEHSFLHGDQTVIPTSMIYASTSIPNKPRDDKTSPLPFLFSYFLFPFSFPCTCIFRLNVVCLYQPVFVIVFKIILSGSSDVVVLVFQYNNSSIFHEFQFKCIFFIIRILNLSLNYNSTGNGNICYNYYYYY